MDASAKLPVEDAVDVERGEFRIDTKLLLHVGSKLFLVGTEITVLLKDGTYLLTSPVVEVVVFERVLHDELHLYRNTKESSPGRPAIAAERSFLRVP